MRKTNTTKRARLPRLPGSSELVRSSGGLAIVPEDELPVLVEECKLSKVRGGAVFEPNGEPVCAKRTDVKDAHDRYA